MTDKPTSPTSLWDVDHVEAEGQDRGQAEEDLQQGGGRQEAHHHHQDRTHVFDWGAGRQGGGHGWKLCGGRAFSSYREIT